MSTKIIDKIKEIDSDEQPIDITSEANLIWDIANKLRGVYMPDDYGKVVIPMTIIRRFECALESTKDKVISTVEQIPDYPDLALFKITGYQFYNKSKFNLKELCNDPDNIAANFKSYISGFSSDVQDILKKLSKIL